MAQTAGHMANGQRPAVGTLWLGESLRWIDRLALTSFLHHGHDVTLFHVFSEPPAGVPDGVRVLPMESVWNPGPDFPADLPPASLADIFRLHLMRASDMIWVDTDVLCLRPLPANDYLVGFEEGGWINNAVLRLPKDSAALTRMLDLLQDPEWVPEWLPPGEKLKVRSADRGKRLSAACKAVPNVLGPRAMTYLLGQTGESRNARPQEVFNPLPWSMADVYFNPHGGVDGWLTDQTLTVHLYASRIRALHLRVAPYPGSFIANLADQVGFSFQGLKPRN